MKTSTATGLPIKGRRFVMLLCSMFLGHAIASGEQGIEWREMLNSQKQSDRDMAAMQLRGTFVPTSKDLWNERLSRVRPGVTASHLEKALAKLGRDTSTPSASHCSSVPCSHFYRLDECYVFRVSYDTQSDHLISSEWEQEP